MVVRASTDVATLIVPLLVLAVSPLPPRPVDVIKPAPVIVLDTPEEVSNVTPPLALSAPATAILLLLVKLKVALPPVTPVTEMARPDWAMVMAAALVPPPLEEDRLSAEVVSEMTPLLVVADSVLPAKPVVVISPDPVMLLPAAVPVRVTPPLALMAPATVMLLLSLNVNEPLPPVTDAIETARPDWAIVVAEALVPPPLVVFN